MASVNLARRAALRTLVNGSVAGALTVTAVAAGGSLPPPEEDDVLKRLQELWPHLAQNYRNGLLAAAEVWVR